MKQNVIIGFMLIVALSACGGRGGSNVTDVVNTGSLELDGTWISNCYYDDEGVYTIDEFTFSGNSFEARYESFNNSSCLGSPLESDSAGGTFTVGNTIIASSGLEAVEVDFIISYQGEIFTALDLIRQEGDQFYYGEFNGSSSRPIDLNFDIVLVKQ